MGAEKRILLCKIWAKRGRGRKEVGHFWAKGVPPKNNVNIYNIMLTRCAVKLLYNIYLRCLRTSYLLVNFFFFCE